MNSSSAFSVLIGEFLVENQIFLSDLKLNVSYEDSDLREMLLKGQFKILSSRAKFQHFTLENSFVRNQAMDGVKNAMNSVTFNDEIFHHPIPYTRMYVQWEANKVSSMFQL